MARGRLTVDDYIAARSEPVRAMLENLRALVRATLPDMAEAMKYGAPMYSGADGAPRIYLHGGKDHAHLGIIGGDTLDDPDGLLEGHGGSRHVVVRPDRWPPKPALVALVGQCAALE